MGEERQKKLAAKKKREEEHRRKRELIKKRRQDELARLEAEEATFVQEDIEKQRILEKGLAKLNKVAEWEDYLENDGTPDPADEPQLNTMMSEWEENDDKELPSTLKACTDAHKVLHRIDNLIQEAVSDTHWQRVAKYMGYRKQLQEQITNKLDISTTHILCNIVAWRKPSPWCKQETCVWSRICALCLISLAPAVF